jgi:hypothetical protein
MSVDTLRSTGRLAASPLLDAVQAVSSFSRSIGVYRRDSKPND